MSLKNFGLYPENHAICQKCLTNVYKRLHAFLDAHDSLRLDIEKESLIYQNEIIFQESAGKDKLAFFLFRDGIRWVEFKKGLKRKEIRVFLKILNYHRTIQEDPEGDLVTALWEAHFPNICYKAFDIYWDSEPILELNLLSVGEADSFGGNISEEEHKSSINTTSRFSEKKLFKLTHDEIAKLQEMIIEDENRDSVKDLLDLASVFLRDQGNKGDLEAILEYIKIEIKYALTQENFQLAYKTLKLLHKMRLGSKTESPWATSIFNNFIRSISGPQYLKIFSKILPTLDKLDLNRFKLIKKFFILLNSNAILTLGPVLSQIRSNTIQQQLMDIVELLAKRNLQSLEKLLSSRDEYMVRNLVCIVGRMKGEKAKQILLKMIHNPSERVREQVFKYLLSRHSVPFKVVFPFIEDSCKNIRQLIFDYLIKNIPEMGETLLIEYLQEKGHLLNDHQQIIDCYKTLGKCGSSRSIPFLQELLFKRRWLPDLRGSIHRQGSVIALIGIETNETKKILQRASKSFFPNVRIAYKRGLEAIH